MFICQSTWFWAHLLLEGQSEVSLRSEGVVAAVADQDLPPDILPVGRRRGIQASVKRNDCLEIRAATGQLDGGGPAEAVADRGKLVRINIRILLQGLESATGTLAKQLAVGFERPGELSRLSGVVGGLGVPEQVRRQRHVALLRQHLRPSLGVIVQAPPLGKHHDARALALNRIVVRQKALARDIPDLIGNGFGFHGGLHRKRAQ